MTIVAEMTGYPAELLDLDLDLEADLGVDTVKQAEVFAAVRDRFDVERDENLQAARLPHPHATSSAGSATRPASSPVTATARGQSVIDPGPRRHRACHDSGGRPPRPPRR